MTRVHGTAIVDKRAELGDDVEIGPYSIIGPHVTVGDASRIMQHCVVDGWTAIGKGCRVFPFATIGTESQDLKYKGAKTFVSIGDGTTIREYVTIHAGTAEDETTRVGPNCFLMAYAHVAHTCTLGDGVIMANCATLGGHIQVEDQAIIGGLSGVHQFCRIGRLCMVGGCTKVTRDCPPFMLVDGNPARVRGTNQVGMRRRGISARSQRLLREAYRVLYRQRLSTRNAVLKIGESLESCQELEHLLSFIRVSKRGIVR